MTVVPLIGNALITFGPSGAIFVLYVYQTPQLVLICIASMVFYMLSIFTVSVASLVPLPHDLRRISYVVLGVVAHECWRLLYVFVYRRVHDGFQHRGKRFRLLVSRFGLLPAAIASGLGYAMAHSLITHGTLLVQSLGPGTLYIPENCSALSFFTVSSLFQCVFAFLNIGWMVLAFQGYSKRSVWRLAILYISHVAASGLTLLNKSIAHSCLVVLPMELVLLCVMIVLVLVELYVEYSPGKEHPPQHNSTTDNHIVAQE